MPKQSLYSHSMQLKSHSILHKEQALRRACFVVWKQSGCPHLSIPVLGVFPWYLDNCLYRIIMCAKKHCARLMTHHNVADTSWEYHFWTTTIYIYVQHFINCIMLWMMMGEFWGTQHISRQSKDWKLVTNEWELHMTQHMYMFVVSMQLA